MQERIAPFGNYKIDRKIYFSHKNKIERFLTKTLLFSPCDQEKKSVMLPVRNDRQLSCKNRNKE